MAKVLHVHGDAGKFRSRLRARMKKAEEIGAHVASYEQRLDEREPIARRPSGFAAALDELKWSDERSDLARRIYQWDSTNERNVKQALGTAAADNYGVSPVPKLWGNADVSAMHEFLSIRTEELRDIERRLPRKRPATARPVGIYNLDELRSSGLFDSDVLDDFEQRLSDIENRRKWRGSIAAAKELVEAVHRATFECLGVAGPPRGTEFVKLGKLARNALVEEMRQQGLVEVARVDANQQLDRALAGLLQALTEVRNEHGAGHGRPRRNPGLQLRHVQLTVETGVVYGRHIIATLNDLGRLP